LINKYRMTKEKRIELFGERLFAVQEELSKRDLSDIPTPKLFEMRIRCSKALEAESIVPEFLSEDDIKNRKKDREIEFGLKEYVRNRRKMQARFGI
jgi:hypothetical protein